MTRTWVARGTCGRPVSGKALKRQAAAELERAEPAGAVDDTEVSLIDAVLGFVVVRPIQHVEHVRADLQRATATESEALGDRGVGIDPRRSAGHVEHVG